MDHNEHCPNVMTNLTLISAINEEREIQNERDREREIKREGDKTLQ